MLVDGSVRTANAAVTGWTGTPPFNPQSQANTAAEIPFFSGDSRPRNDAGISTVWAAGAEGSGAGSKKSTTFSDIRIRIKQKGKLSRYGVRAKNRRCFI